MMAWLWRSDIDDEKRTPGIIFRLRNRFGKRNVTVARASSELAGLGLRAGWTVLDFGCGPGNYSVAAAMAVGESGSVQALDLHPLALDMVSAKAKAHNLSNIETIYSDLDTGLEPGSVDAILLFESLSGRREIRSLLTEFHRILKTNGTLHVRDSGFKPDRLQELMVKDGLFHLAGTSGGVHSFAKLEGDFHEI